MIDLVAQARSLFAPRKGLLAIDLSVRSAERMFARYDIKATEEMRRQYRDLFLGTPGIEEYISGVILFSENLTQKGSDKKKFPASLAARGIVPGVKVDLGTEPFADHAKEQITQGLIDLPERLQTYKKEEPVFTKWRAVFTINGDASPSAQAIHENAKRLAIYAKEAQTAGLVPILEPEVLYQGTYSRLRAKAVLSDVLDMVFRMCAKQSVDRASLILKTSMVLSGPENKKKDTPEEVAEDTLEVFMANVPKQIAGIVFLSGGQTPDQATANLCAIARRARAVDAPWPISFSFNRAIQEEALDVWKGKKESVPAARDVFLTRLKKVSAASVGEDC